MQLSMICNGLKNVYRRTTLIEGTVHLVRGSWKMCKVLILSAYWRHNFARAGKNVSVFPKTIIHYPRNISVGDNFSLNHASYLRNENSAATLTAGNDVAIGMHCEVDYSGGLRIGDGAVISDWATIHTHNHGYNPRSAATYKELVIERNAWIGGGATILPQVSRVGEGAIVGACAVVTRDVEPFTIVAGNPARVIKKLPRLKTLVKRK